MLETFIKIKDGMYVVTDGNFKIVKGDFTEESLKGIDELSQKIETINEEKEYYEKEIKKVQIMKKNAKSAWLMRIFPSLICIISLTASGISAFGTIYLLSLCTGLQILVEKGIKWTCGTKKEREEREKSATTMLESLNHHLKVHEKTLEEEKEKMKYKEIPYEGDRIVKAIFDKVDKTKTWDDVLYTEEEIHQYMQMPEAPAPFNQETIFGIDENQDQTDNLQQEQDGPVLTKKLTPPKK